MQEKEDLTITPIDLSRSIPLYQQVYMNLVTLIQTGQVKAGDMLPPEMELSKKFKVSRQTMRDALGMLEAEGLILRTAGLGTVVTEQINRSQYFLKQSFSYQMREKGIQLRTKVIKQNARVINFRSPIPLREKKGAQAMELFRLRYAGKEPLGIQMTTVIIDSCPELLNVDFSSASLYELLIQKYQFTFKRIDHTVKAVLADDTQKSLLRLKAPTALLFINSTTYLLNEEPIETTTSFLLSKYFTQKTSYQFNQKISK